MWRAKEEAWLRSVAWFDELTLKASVGTSGNSAIGEYAWQGVVEGSDTYKGGGLAMGWRTLAIATSRGSGS